MGGAQSSGLPWFLAEIPPVPLAPGGLVALLGERLF